MVTEPGDGTADHGSGKPDRSEPAGAAQAQTGSTSMSGSEPAPAPAQPAWSQVWPAVDVLGADHARRRRHAARGRRGAAVAVLVGVTFLVGGITQLVVASRVQSWRWLFILSGILGVAAGILTFAWPDITLYVVSILVAWYLIAFGIIHMIDTLAGPKVGGGGPGCCRGSPSWSWESGRSAPGSGRC
jgi:MFS family permease